MNSVTQEEDERTTFNTDDKETVKEIELFDIIEDIGEGTTVNILHHVVTDDGTSAMVYEIGDVRTYRAMEYILEDGSPCRQYGYSTTHKHHYMGERYRTLWGEFESEVYYQPNG